MTSIQDALPWLEAIIKGLAEHFGDKCEFVIHDYSKDFSSSIIAIENGSITGRTVGKGGTNIGLSLLKGVENNDGKFRYVCQTMDGRRLLSSTIFLKDDAGKVLGTFCLNYDITDFINAQNVLDAFTSTKSSTPTQELTVFEDIDELLISMIKESIEIVGVPVSYMTREQKRDGIQFLNRKGAFKIKNAVNIVASYYDTSRYTVYNYLNEVVDI